MIYLKTVYIALRKQSSVCYETKFSTATELCMREHESAVRQKSLTVVITVDIADDDQMLYATKMIRVQR